jgi:copper homeostasis protein
VSSRITLEVAVTTAEEAVRAVEAGADRLELCTALEVGGVTPSPGTYLSLRDRVPTTPIYVLLRPRPGGFCYTDSEFKTVLRDAAWFMTNGAAGIVCGALDERGGIDTMKSYNLFQIALGKCVFHRAFDFLTDQFAALEQLIKLGFERVLTSGGETTALKGSTRIAELIRHAAGRVEVLPGSGINPENVTELVRTTGCTQVHGSFRSAVRESASDAKTELARQMGPTLSTDAETIRNVRAMLDVIAGG